MSLLKMSETLIRFLNFSRSMRGCHCHYFYFYFLFNSSQEWVKIRWRMKRKLINLLGILLFKSLVWICQKKIHDVVRGLIECRLFQLRLEILRRINWREDADAEGFDKADYELLHGSCGFDQRMEAAVEGGIVGTNDVDTSCNIQWARNNPKGNPVKTPSWFLWWEFLNSGQSLLSGF